MAIYKVVKGEQVKMSNREIKQYIMKVNGWTSEQYDKQYDIFKNKVRAFEAYEKQHGRTRIEKQSPVEILYKEARSKAIHGENYKPSLQMQRIRRFTSVSSGKKGQQALQGTRYQQRRSALYAETTLNAFDAFIKQNPTAQRIIAEIKDPVKREEALIALAEKVKARRDEQGRVQANEQIPFGEVQGSDVQVDDFNIDAYK